ncbi:serine/threonine-protein kinase [Pseudoduganella danionis]|uniref:serine/threonine-protein kinase n=1 Tax=Pseudoduganella danionis TaxID=1890295 RepID=UPI0035AE8F53
MTIITLELGHYRLQEQIGRSAYGVIWRASGPANTRDVALKFINHEQMAQAEPALRERWIASAQNEIGFLQALEPWDERHIVRLLDSGWHQGLPVLALELLATDLGRHMQAQKTSQQAVPLPRLLSWVSQINQALAKVHQYGWRYLDLKPANVLLDWGLQTVKLADFGTNRRGLYAELHSYAGTANWQAPEQFFPQPEGSYQSSAASDYFSLGAMLYFLVTGGTPLQFCAACGNAYRSHQNAGAGLLLQASGGMLPATLQEDEAARFCAALPAGARDSALLLLRSLLHPDPAQRPRHAIQISRMLHAIQGMQPERNYLDVTDPVRGMRRPTAANGWQTMRSA